jgi:hypothetical protein
MEGNLLTLPGIETQFFGRPTSSLQLHQADADNQEG